MTERYPEYYENFRCIADRCEDTCCAGWEIDIDDTSYENYMRVEGPLGERLRTCIRSYEPEEDGGYEEVYAGHGFILTPERRCPFLDDNNLCVLYRELGEASLCEVCTNTPRNFLEYGGIREISISASCPEAARLIYALPEPMRFKERETEDAPFDAPEEEDDAELVAFLQKVRDEAIALLQDRSRPIPARVERFLSHAEAVQDAINRWEAGEEDLPAQLKADLESDFCGERTDSTPVVDLKAHDLGEAADNNAYRRFLQRMDIYSGLASIGPAWAGRITLLYDRFCDEAVDGRSAYLQATEGLLAQLSDEDRLYEYEHLLVYYAFLLLNRCIDDYDYRTKALLVAMSWELNRDMDAAVWAEKGSFTKKDREDNARIYAREVEHAEENLADLYEELLFSRKM